MSLTSLEPESSASANSAISANHEYYYSIAIRICQHLFSNFFRKIIFSSFFYFCLLVSVLDVCEHYIQSCLPSFPEQNILHAYRKPVHTVPYEACHLHLDQWSRNLICFSWSQMTLLKFIDISSRFYAAPVCLTDQSGWCEVNNKLSAFFNDIIRISAGTNRDIGHWRIRVDNAGPGNGNDIWFFFAAAADHCWSYRCQQGRAFPEYFRHLFETSFP